MAPQEPQEQMDSQDHKGKQDQWVLRVSLGLKDPKDPRVLKVLMVTPVHLALRANQAHKEPQDQQG